MKPKMIYLSNVSWNWIKQRPQFLAEQLSNYFDVDVYCRIDYKRENYVNENENNIVIHKLFRLPFERNALIAYLNNILAKLQLKKVLNKYKYIWIADPKVYRYISEYLSKDQILIYDCMDDQLEFPQIKKSKHMSLDICESEKKLIDDCDIVFFSSKYLKNTVLKRYAIDDNKGVVLNNGINNFGVESAYYDFLDKNYKEENLSGNDGGIKRIVYFGTISEWFDWEIIEETLNKYKNIQIHLYGPCEVEVPSYANLIYHGVVSHDLCIKEAKKADAFIMPFIVTDLIKSVNPVKLYEYISLMKPTIAVQYDESNQFSDYVYLYRNKEEYIKYINDFMQDKLNLKKGVRDTIRFINNNTWKQRGKNIINLMKENNIY